MKPTSAKDVSRSYGRLNDACKEGVSTGTGFRELEVIQLAEAMQYTERYMIIYKAHQEGTDT